MCDRSICLGHFTSVETNQATAELIVKGTVVLEYDMPAQLHKQLTAFNVQVVSFKTQP